MRNEDRAVRLAFQTVWVVVLSSSSLLLLLLLLLLDLHVEFPLVGLGLGLGLSIGGGRCGPAVFWNLGSRYRLGSALGHMALIRLFQAWMIALGVMR